MVADTGDALILALLDVTLAFDTVDHTILLHRLLSGHHRLGDIVRDWFESYLRERCQSMTYVGLLSSPISLEHGVPQGSVFGPLLFIMYTVEVPHS